MPLIGKPLLIILGPTAVGKTHLAIELAEELGSEVISADSRQIYKYMDIGTAKPTNAECQRIPHHLINIIEPDDNLTLAEYQDKAYAAIRKLHEQDKVPLLVGGTGQYITAVEEGWSIPRVPPNYALRQQLETQAEQNGKEAFHAQLAAVDPESAQNIHPNNVRRVIRAMEVYLETGTPISALQRKSPPPYRIKIIGLTMEREALYQRADRRVDNMIAAGFIEEVKFLLEKGYDRILPSMSGLGYPEIVSYLLDEIPIAEAISKIKFSTHDFIRRQYVWFRGHDNGILWHNMETFDRAAMLADIQNWLEES